MFIKNEGSFIGNEVDSLSLKNLVSTSAIMQNFGYNLYSGERGNESYVLALNHFFVKLSRYIRNVTVFKYCTFENIRNYVKDTKSTLTLIQYKMV